MFNSDEFLGPAERMPLLFQAAHLHVLKTITSTVDFTSIVNDSQVLMNSTCSMLWQIHTTCENMDSMFSSLRDGIGANKAAGSSAIAKAISEWIEELVEEVEKIKKRWSMLDVKLHAEWKKIIGSKTFVMAGEMSSEPSHMHDFYLEENPDLRTNLKSISQCLGQAWAVLQEIICFLDKVRSQLQERKQEWRKVLIFLNSQDPGLWNTVKTAEGNWYCLSSRCKQVKMQFDEKSINQLYNKVLYEDPRDLTKEQWAFQEADCLARVKRIEWLSYD